MEKPEQQAVLDVALSISGLDEEFLSELPLHVIMIRGEDNENVRRVVELDHFWELWVKKHIFPRHTDKLIRSVPGKMKWRYYARMHGRWVSSELYIADKEGDQSRFFHYRTVPGITKAARVQYRLFLLVDGKLAMEDGVAEKYTYNRGQEPLIYADMPAGEKFVDFVSSAEESDGGLVSRYTYNIYLLTQTGRLFVQEIVRRYRSPPDLAVVTDWSDDDLHDTLVQEGVDRKYPTRSELVGGVMRALGRTHVLSDLSPVELSSPHYISQITDSHFLNEHGDLFPFHVDPNDYKKLVVGKVGRTGCLWVHSRALYVQVYAPQRRIRDQSETIEVGMLTEDLRPLQIVASSLERNAKMMKLINTDWRATTKSQNAYLYLSEPYTRNRKKARLGVKSNVVSDLSKVSPTAKDKPIMAYGDHPVRGWSGRRAAWTTDGNLYTISSSAGAGNGVYTNIVGNRFPEKKMRLAIGIPDLVVGCIPDGRKFVALAVALPRSRKTIEAVSSLDDEAIRHLAKMLYYPSWLYEGNISRMVDLLSREDEDVIMAKLDVLERVSVAVEPLLLMKGTDLSWMAKEENITHFVVKTKDQLVYSIAQAAVASEKEPVDAKAPVGTKDGDKVDIGRDKTPVVSLKQLMKDAGPVVSLKQLKERATVLKIAGRSKMNKDELMKALSGWESDPTSYMSLKELREKAAELKIAGRSKMKKLELAGAVKRELLGKK